MNTEFDLIRNVSQSFDAIQHLNHNPYEAERARNIFRPDCSPLTRDCYANLCVQKVEGVYDWFILSGQLSFREDGGPCPEATQDTAILLLQKLGIERNETYDSSVEQLCAHVFETVYNHNTEIKNSVLAEATNIGKISDNPTKVELLLYRTGLRFAEILSSERSQKYIYVFTATIITLVSVLAVVYAPSTARLCFSALPLSAQSTLMPIANIVAQYHKVIDLPFDLAFLAISPLLSLTADFSPLALAVTIGPVFVCCSVLAYLAAVIYKVCFDIFIYITIRISDFHGKAMNRLQRRLSRAMIDTTQKSINDIESWRRDRAYQVWMSVTQNARESGIVYVFKEPAAPSPCTPSR